MNGGAANMADQGDRIRDEALAAVTRAGMTENVHRGRVCVVSADTGGIIESFGDAGSAAYVRSAAKPIQAIAPLLGGVAERFGWDDRHLALLAASQRGYPAQMAALEEMLATSGVPEEAFVFHPAKPVGSEPREQWAAVGGKPRKLYHTCAGKHLGMLGWCRLRGWPIEGYAEPDHPAQAEIMKQVREWAGAEEGECTVGRDGCGIPVTAMPLKKIALAYARLACPDTAPDERAAAAAAKVAAAMNRYPGLVEGRGRLASLLLGDANIVAKSGAQGLFAIGLRRERIGIAVHLSDGSEQPWAYVVLELLRRHGGASEETIRSITARFPAEYRNDAGTVSGRWKTVFGLHL